MHGTTSTDLPLTSLFLLSFCDNLKFNRKNKYYPSFTQDVCFDCLLGIIHRRTLLYQLIKINGHVRLFIHKYYHCLIQPTGNKDKLTTLSTPNIFLAPTITFSDGIG